MLENVKDIIPMLWLIYTARDRAEGGTGNGIGIIGNNGSWPLSLSRTGEHFYIVY